MAEGNGGAGIQISAQGKKERDRGRGEGGGERIRERTTSAQELQLPTSRNNGQLENNSHRQSLGLFISATVGPRQEELEVCPVRTAPTRRKMKSPRMLPA